MFSPASSLPAVTVVHKCIADRCSRLGKKWNIAEYYQCMYTTHVYQCFWCAYRDFSFLHTDYVMTFVGDEPLIIGFMVFFPRGCGFQLHSGVLYAMHREVLSILHVHESSFVVHICIQLLYCTVQLMHSSHVCF
jgi:hypothetical protein